VGRNVATVLSVLIASRHRRELLRRCLETLVAQDEDPARFEVIVACDGCSEGSAELVEGMETPFRLRALRLPRGGKSAALNAALNAAEGDACLFLDDDIVAAPTLVAAHRRAQESERVLGIGLIVEQPPDEADWLAHAFARGWAEHNAELLRRPARWNDCYGANFSAPCDALLEIGGFSTDLAVAEDFDIALRLCKVGCRPTYLPEAAGVHDDQKRGRRMLEDAEAAGRIHVRLSERFPEGRPDLLDWNGSAGRLGLAVRRLCLALRVPPPALAWPGRFLPGEGRRMIWLHFVRSLAFWRGVRGAISRRDWALLIGGGER
jgi:glycosyltransferase involved in cell wall biosynthesis